MCDSDNSAHMLGFSIYLCRAMAETLGRSPPASRYSTNMARSIGGRDDLETKFTQTNFRRKFGNVPPSPVQD